MIVPLSVVLESKLSPQLNARSSILMVLARRFAIGIVSKAEKWIVKLISIVEPTLENGHPGLIAP